MDSSCLFYRVTQGVISDEGQHFVVLTGNGSFLEQVIYSLKVGVTYTVAFAAAGEQRSNVTAGVLVAADSTTLTPPGGIVPQSADFQRYVVSFVSVLHSFGAVFERSPRVCDRQEVHG